MHLQQRLMLFPVHIGHKLDSAAVRIENNILLDCGLRCLSRDFQYRAHRTDFCPFHVLYGVHIPVFFCIININIPVVKINRLILVHAQQVCALSLLNYLAVILLVVNAGEHALFVKFNAVKRRFQLVVP